MNRWAPSALRRPIQMSFTSAWARRTTARVPPLGTASGAPRTAAKRGIIWVLTTRSPSIAWRSIPPIRRLSLSRPWAIFSGRTRNAASIARWMAARRGQNRNTSIPTPVSTMWPSIPRIPKSSTLLLSSGVARGGVTTAADRAARSGNRRTAATPGPSLRDRAGRNRRTIFTGESRFPSFPRNRPRFMRRWRPERAPAPAAAPRPRAVPLRPADAARRQANPPDPRVKRQPERPRRRQRRAEVAEDAAQPRPRPIRTAAASSAPTMAARHGPSSATRTSAPPTSARSAWTPSMTRRFSSAARRARCRSMAAKHGRA